MSFWDSTRERRRYERPYFRDPWLAPWEPHLPLPFFPVTGSLQSLSYSEIEKRIVFQVAKYARKTTRKHKNSRTGKYKHRKGRENILT